MCEEQTFNAVLELREGMRWVQLERRNLHARAGMDGNGNAAERAALEQGRGQVDTIVPCDRMSVV